MNLPFKPTKDAYQFGSRASGEVHGVVLTKPHIVELVLDLAGYTMDRDLGSIALLEPSCGQGAFLLGAVTRLLESAKRASRSPSTLGNAILAFDIVPQHATETKRALLELLLRHRVTKAIAERLVNAWVREGDFLLATIEQRFQAVVGNPPYIRTEQLCEPLQAEYRRRYVSLYDRADIYVAFIERGLSLLNASGILSFICADRWISNKYGAPLRQLVSSRYNVRAYIDLHKASPFESKVLAYPSIFVMGQGRTEGMPVVTLETGSEAECVAAAQVLAGRKKISLPTGVTVANYKTWFVGDEPWVLSSPAHLESLRSLESRFAPVETTARVGIGVATGCDRLYIVKGDADIESERLVPLVMRDDIDNGTVKQANRFVINAFDDGGGVVDLAKYPRLRNYLTTHADAIRKRHVSQQNPASWFRTIDRVYPQLVRVPKLLIPDIAGSNEVVFEEGHYHPHHNLYFVVSDVWDMEVLGGLLSSRMALFFVWSYAVKMRGGYLRFQAQYLRRIRLPDPKGLAPRLTTAIKTAFKQRDFNGLDALSLEAYGLTKLPEFDFVDTRR